MRKLQGFGRPLGTGQDRFNAWVQRIIDEIVKASAEPSETVPVPAVADTAIADIANKINTRGKYAGRIAYDTVNHRLMVANGPLAADPWYVADGSASVTPA